MIKILYSTLSKPQLYKGIIKTEGISKTNEVNKHNWDDALDYQKQPYKSIAPLCCAFM